MPKQAPVSQSLAKWTVTLSLAFSLVLLAGCDPQPVKSPDPTSAGSQTSVLHDSEVSQFSDSLDGLTLVRNLTTRYALAQSYRDQGVLQLSYTLNEKAIVEPHPFSTCWERGNRLSSRLFQAHLQSDGKLLSCYVFDINTGNLDEQQLFLPVESGLPMSQLYEDSIVRHYLGGYADLPLDETDKTQQPQLVPPPLALLAGQLSFGWIQDPQIAKRLPDQLLDGRRCYVVRSQFRQMTADLWIDQESKLIRQISMPLKIMDRQVLTAGEIKHVELLMQFKDAQIDAPREADPSKLFATALKPKATPVRKFVAVPDPFPSERLGQLVPKFELLRPSGEVINHLHFDGKTAVLFWAGQTELEPIEKAVAKYREKPQPKEVAFGLVYSDADLKQATPQSLVSLVPQDALQELAQRAGIDLLFDRQLKTSGLFQLRVLPAAIVIGPDSRLEYVGAMANDNWDQELAVVIDKVRSGADVAGEMKQDYQEFQAEYRKQRLAASARSLLNLPEPQTQAGSNLLGPSELALASSWKPSIIWSNKSLTQPGNIVVNPHRSPPSLLVMDGWRSIVELDLKGQELGRHTLELPEQGAVSCLRVKSTSAAIAGGIQYAGFNVQADRIYLFDREWKLQSTLPPTEYAHDGIRDALFLPEKSPTDPLLLVALANDGGCVEFDNQQRVIKQVFRSRADSIALVGEQAFFANPTNWGRLKDDGLQRESGEGLMYQKLIAVNPNQATPGSVLADFGGVTAVDRENNWFFGRLGTAGKLAWRQPIGSQLFENEIEPLSSCVVDLGGALRNSESAASEMVVVAIADASHRVTLVSGDGTFLGQFSAPAPLAGIALISAQDALHLILSTQEGIANYRLSMGGVSATPVSNKKQP